MKHNCQSFVNALIKALKLTRAQATRGDSTKIPVEVLRELQRQETGSGRMDPIRKV
jgi:hypothetical protein